MDVLNRKWDGIVVIFGEFCDPVEPSVHRWFSKWFDFRGSLACC